MTLLKRIIQVDHCENYRAPKYSESVPVEIRTIWEEGCAPKAINIPEGNILILNLILGFQIDLKRNTNLKKEMLKIRLKNMKRLSHCPKMILVKI